MLYEVITAAPQRREDPVIVPFAHILILAAALFVMGLGCALARRNLIMILIGVEIMLV